MTLLRAGLALCFVGAALGCSSTLPPSSPACPGLVPTPVPATVAGPAEPGPPDLSVRVTSSGSTSTLTIRLRHEKVGPTAWRVPASGARVSKIQVKDRLGILAASLDSAGARITVTDARPLQPPLELSYEVAAPDAPRGCPLEITPDRAVFCGSAVLVLPETGAEQRSSLLLELAPDPTFHKRAASSFGLDEAVTSRASLEDVARAAFVFGDVGRARFDATEGRDHAAWVGFFSFDPRWVAAEAAGVRTLADRWLGVSRPADDPSIGLVFLPAPRTARGVHVRPGLRGAIIEADVGAAWTARARVEITRLLLQRTIGTSVTVRVMGAAPMASLFFDEGFAHAGALEVLADSGVITRDERLGEVNALLAAEALSPQAGKSLAELARTARDGTSEERSAAAQLLAVRGALAALSLSEGGAGLSPIVKDAVRAAASAGAPELGLDQLLEVARARAGAPRADAALGALEQGRRIPMSSAGLGPCATLKDTTFYRFQLGYTATRAGDQETVTGVLGGSAAEAAGLRAGDVVTSADLTPDSANVPVQLTLASGKKLSYLPRGAGKKGKAFTPVNTPACKAS
jgi:hypothetical protein